MPPKRRGEKFNRSNSTLYKKEKKIDTKLFKRGKRQEGFCPRAFRVSMALMKP
jgi:hypothetical protein